MGEDDYKFNGFGSHLLLKAIRNCSTKSQEEVAKEIEKLVSR